MKGQLVGPSDSVSLIVGVQMTRVGAGDNDIHAPTLCPLSKFQIPAPSPGITDRQWREWKGVNVTYSRFCIDYSHVVHSLRG